VRDEVVDFVNEWRVKTEIPQVKFIGWLGVGASKYHDWRQRYGKVNEHNEWIPRDHWLEDWEKSKIIDYYMKNPFEGYRRLTHMMIDADVVAVSPSSVYRVLKDARLIEPRNGRVSKKGTGFKQPTRPHQHWHVDIAMLNLGGTFYYLIGVLDGYSRAIVQWDIRASMTSADVQLVIQRAREHHKGERPRVISDNGPQFVAKEFKSFIKEAQMTHVRTSPYYPQSNGKKERFVRTYRGLLRFVDPATLQEAHAATEKIIRHYNEERLHAALGYITPKDKLAGRDTEIFAERERKLAEARERRAAARAKARDELSLPAPAPDHAVSCEAATVPA